MNDFLDGVLFPFKAIYRFIKMTPILLSIVWSSYRAVMSSMPDWLANSIIISVWISIGKAVILFLAK